MVKNDTVTLNGLQQDIYYLSKTTSATFTTGDMNRIINKYYRQLQSDIRNLNEDFYLLVAITNLIISDGSYSLPDGLSGTAPAYEKIKSILVSLAPANKNIPLKTEFERVQIIQPNSVTDPSYEFTQPTAIMFGDYFVLHPLVTDVTKYPVVGGVKIYYVPVLSDLVNDTDIPKIFPDYHDVIVWGSLIDIAIRLGKTELFTKATSMYKKRREEMKESASNRVLDGQSGVIEGQDTVGGWAFPFGNQSMS